MVTDVAYETPPRRYQRISLPQGMFVAWYGGGDHQTSRVQTLGMGGVFIASCDPPPVGSKMRLVFEVLGPQDRILLDRLLKRLLH